MCLCSRASVFPDEFQQLNAALAKVKEAEVKVQKKAVQRQTFHFNLEVSHISINQF